MFIYTAFKSHTEWSKVQRVSPPPTMILSTMEDTSQNLNWFCHMMYAPKTIRSLNIAKHLSQAGNSENTQPFFLNHFKTTAIRKRQKIKFLVNFYFLLLIFSFPYFCLFIFFSFFPETIRNFILKKESPPTKKFLKNQQKKSSDIRLTNMFLFCAIPGLITKSICKYSFPC